MYEEGIMNEQRGHNMFVLDPSNCDKGHNNIKRLLWMYTYSKVSSASYPSELLGILRISSGCRVTSPQDWMRGADPLFLERKSSRVICARTWGVIRWDFIAVYKRERISNAIVGENNKAYGLYCHTNTNLIRWFFNLMTSATYFVFCNKYFYTFANIFVY